jgi:hypothetical protein
MPLSHGEAGACASGQGIRSPRGKRITAGHYMGTIVKFPDEGRIVRFGREDVAQDPATVIILPVVRIERYQQPRADDIEPRTHPPADNGGRRRMRRR